MMLSCEALSSKDQVVNIERLLQIVNQRDFSKINATDSIEVTLQRFFPEVPKESLNKIAQQSGQLLKAKQPVELHQGKEFFYVKLSLAIAMAVAGLYCGGPLAAAGAKAVVTQIYTILFGIPQSSCLAYHLLLLPCQKYANALALTYGPYVMGLTAGPATYSGLSLAEYLGQKINHLRQWAFAGSITPDVDFSIATASIDDILEEFTELTFSEDESDRDDCYSDDDFVMIYPGFENFKQQQGSEKTLDTHSLPGRSLKLG